MTSQNLPWALCCTHWRHITTSRTWERWDLSFSWQHDTRLRSSDKSPSKGSCGSFCPLQRLHSALPEVVPLCTASLFPKQHNGFNNQHRWVTVTFVQVLQSLSWAFLALPLPTSPGKLHPVSNSSCSLQTTFHLEDCTNSKQDEFQWYNLWLIHAAACFIFYFSLVTCTVL